MNHITLRSILLSLALAWASGASATLIGDSVTHERNAVGCCGSGSIFDSSTQIIAVGGTTFVAALHNVIVSDALIQLVGKNDSSSFYSGNTFADQFSDIFGLDWAGPPAFIIGVNVSVIGDLGLASGLAFNSLTDVSFTADSVRVRLAGLNFHRDSRIDIELVTSAAPPVPEPATLGLLGIAFAAAGYAKRRKSA